MENGVIKDHSLPKRLILVGISGASCSGKTTLAKHLRSVLKGSFIVHQDDFAPPEELVPMHPVHNVQDWDDPEGAIEWPRMASFIRRVREEGRLPNDYRSHDGLNKQDLLPVSDDLASEWAQKFLDIQEHARKEQGVELIWGLVDGFLLYWHPDVVHELDVRLFLRVSYDTLKARRDRRFGYHTAGGFKSTHDTQAPSRSLPQVAIHHFLVIPLLSFLSKRMLNPLIAVQFSPEGSLWQDPPGYWDDIVWPAYLKAHKNIFVGGDVSYGDAVVIGEGHGVESPIVERFSAIKGTRGGKGEKDGEPGVNGFDSASQSEGEDERRHKDSPAVCGRPVPRLIILPAETMDMEGLFETACTALQEAV